MNLVSAAAIKGYQDQLKIVEDEERLTRITRDHSIRIRDLNVYIENQHILRDINLSIPEKSITCIIGPSGCGKTTLLKTLKRMHDEAPEVRNEGQVMVDGEYL
jgi:phosphate transport system ATP-binding protein